MRGAIILNRRARRRHPFSSSLSTSSSSSLAIGRRPSSSFNALTSPPEENTCDEHITHSTLRRTIVTSAFPSIGRRFARSHQEYKEEDDEAFPPPPLDAVVVKVVVKVFSAESMCISNAPSSLLCVWSLLRNYNKGERL